MYHSLTLLWIVRFTLDEVKKCLTRAKCDKAVGLDMIPMEVLNNDTACHFLLQLFHKCFEKNIVPSMWMKCFIKPLSKDNTWDPRDPMNYRGITLACTMYKSYCGVLNSRFVAWVEVNGLIEDKQNGFKADRSCVDHLSSLTNIIETRKLLKLSTQTAFIDVSKAFDRIRITKQDAQIHL